MSPSGNSPKHCRCRIATTYAEASLAFVDATVKEIPSLTRGNVGILEFRCAWCGEVIFRQLKEREG